MKRWRSAAIILLTAFQAGIACADFTGKGHVHTHATTKQDFLNPDCHISNTCDLKRFTLTKARNEIWFSDNRDHPTYADGVIIEYETDSVGTLEKYAVVQFKKGCVFESYRNSNGYIQRNISDTVASFGEQVPFCFRQWVIDSQDRDPVYNSDPDYGRFYLLRWNKPGSYDNRSQKFYGMQKPAMPVVYLVDYPAGAFITRSAIRNVALEFRTCIFKARAVPTATERTDVEFAKPIKCFEWQNVYIYDFAKAAFSSDLATLPQWDEPTPVVEKNQRRWLATLLLIVIAVASYVSWRGFHWAKRRF